MSNYPRIIVGNLESVKEEWAEAYGEGYKLVAVTQVGMTYTMFLVIGPKETPEDCQIASLQEFQAEFAHVHG